ncbi:hypothetical protein [Clostridium sp. LIBA-8841]|uniref:hypothetical protein n=1 Tax=Clostridium sp. LIBA-8841 TaxID=2987530 RepID=UPI002AC5D0D7|nr:hypothetical protein [Clostridium sp. LIBA-8841]MDZ5253563.1 hypothetical protein [Clostridium sp. LIBA-8841]
MIKEEVNLKLKNQRIMYILLLIIAIFVIFYQKNEINSYKKSLTISLEENMDVIIRESLNLRDDEVYNKVQGHIKAAVVASKGLEKSEWLYGDGYEWSLRGLFYEFEHMMNDSKERACIFFEKEEVQELLSKISCNLEDRTSINKLIKLVGY